MSLCTGIDHHVLRRAVLATAMTVTSMAAGQPLCAQAEQKSTPPASPTQETASPATPRTTPIQLNGQKIFIDPQTGRLRPPTAAEAKELSDALAKIMTASPEAPQVVYGPDGMMSVTLDPAAMDASVATLTSDGTLTMRCVHGKEAADRAVKEHMAKNHPPTPPVAKKAPQLEDKE